MLEPDARCTHIKEICTHRATSDQGADEQEHSRSQYHPQAELQNAEVAGLEM
jgi:hypothetical protein